MEEQKEFFDYTARERACLVIGPKEVALLEEKGLRVVRKEDLAELEVSRMLAEAQERK